MYKTAFKTAKKSGYFKWTDGLRLKFGLKLGFKLSFCLLLDMWNSAVLCSGISRVFMQIVSSITIAWKFCQKMKSPTVFTRWHVTAWLLQPRPSAAFRSRSIRKPSWPIWNMQIRRTVSSTTSECRRRRRSEQLTRLLLLSRWQLAVLWAVTSQVSLSVSCGVWYYHFRVSAQIWWVNVPKFEHETPKFSFTRSRPQDCSLH